MIRACLILIFSVLLTGCVKPVQMEIPIDHPANPEAGAAPATVQNDYIFHLPNDDVPGESDSAKKGHVSDKAPAEAGMKSHSDHESMSSEKKGGEHGH